MQKNSITNKITPCCGLPFSVIYWWVSNLTLNSESDRQYLLTQISQSGVLSIDGWKVLINSGTLEADASLTKSEFLAWFDCGKQPKCEQLKLIIEGFKVGNWTPETELPLNIALIDMVIDGVNVNGNVYTKEQTDNLITSSFGGDLLISDDPQPTAPIWFFAKESGTYVNAGGLVVDVEGQLVILSYNGTEWDKLEVLLPQANNLLLNDVLINASVNVKKTTAGGVTIDILGDGIVYDALGGYRYLKAYNYSFSAGNNVIYLSSSATEYIEPNLGVSGAGESIYLFSENYGTKHYYPNRRNSFSVASLSVSQGYFSKIPTFDVTPEIVDRFVKFEQKGTLPSRDFSNSKFINELNYFIEKYRERKSDVTIVQTGDSISTNLGWTTPREDQSYLPPFMTEHNFNSYLEEKLRWREQKYRRFDSLTNSVATFTEILGGGTTVQKSEDGISGAWGVTGAAYSLPLTKVLDGGTNAGVSYKFPAEMRRCNFILHTDYLWADTTTITVAEGNGKVQVKNDADVWVEANGYVFSAKESATLINGAFRKSQEQKRVHMRSLTDLTEKNITIQNVGTGRFGYWGIEYSPNEFMFTYIAASIGSQALYGMSFYETWRVDAFKPDLLLQQCCIINEGAVSGEVGVAGITPEGFVQHFEDDYDRQISKGYLVMPYIVWGGAVMGMVNPTTGEWGFSTYNGKNLTIDDYIGKLMNMYKSKNAPAINFFYRFTELAETKAKLEGTNNIYTSAINGSGATGNTFTKDTVHLNDYGEEILKRLLIPYFNF